VAAGDFPAFLMEFDHFLDWCPPGKGEFPGENRRNPRLRKFLCENLRIKTSSGDFIGMA
jgi:hypothetical protein